MHKRCMANCATVPVQEMNQCQRRCPGSVLSGDTDGEEFPGNSRNYGNSASRPGYDGPGESDFRNRPSGMSDFPVYRTPGAGFLGNVPSQGRSNLGNVPGANRNDQGNLGSFGNPGM